MAKPPEKKTSLKDKARAVAEGGVEVIGSLVGVPFVSKATKLVRSKFPTDKEKADANWRRDTSAELSKLIEQENQRQTERKVVAYAHLGGGTGYPDVFDDPSFLRSSTVDHGRTIEFNFSADMADTKYQVSVEPTPDAPKLISESKKTNGFLITPSDPHSVMKP
jgi:hypothetical protein